jgi:galactose mutarotase-like enzyme
MSTIERIELRDGAASSAATVAPGRGAIVTSFRVGDREVLYLDEATLQDPTKNVRGGVPLLFPSPGPLTGGRFSRAGRSGAMKQHGFARELAWTVRERGERDLVLTLASSERTLAAYPWRFALEARFALRGKVLRFDLRVDNQDDAPMPFAFGTHPYFLVRDKARARVPTPATRAFDNVKKEVGPFRGFDLTAPEVDVHLFDHGSSAARLELGDGTAVAIRASDELRRWVVWTLAGKDFVCVEPWSAPGDALNTGESLIELAPGASRGLWIEMDAEG